MDLNDHVVPAPLPWAGMPPSNESVGKSFEGKGGLIVL